MSANGVCNDYSGNARHIVQATDPPVLTANVFAGKYGWHFDATKNPLMYTGATVTPKHIFILASYDDATFNEFRALLSGASGASGQYLLLGDNGTDHFVDPGLGANFAYRKNDIAHPDNDAKAPIDGTFALIEVQMPSGFTLDDIQVGNADGLSNHAWKGYFVEMFMYDRVLTDAERQSILLYFNLEFQLHSLLGLNLYFPSDSFVPYRRRRFYAEPPMFSKITDTFEFEDGGKTFNEVADTAPRRWEYDYRFVNSTLPTDPGEVRLFDEFYEMVRLATPFNFTDKYGTVWDNVRIENYDRDHDAHKPWRQTIKFRLIRYPN